MPNRLAAEKSPYLLQHANNPVDWYAWGDEAFSAARRDDKPIFLSIGYSTCHWCHVMEHESFENPDVADVLNREFVPVKVDREERPDVDRVYMAFVQATTGAGGWPMSVWLTPQLQPFFGGTYFPPTSRWQRPGFIDVLQEVARVWKTDRTRVVDSASALLERLRVLEDGGDVADGVPGDGALARARAHFTGSYDTRHGGFGTGTKFPRPSELLFLFREFARAGDDTAREMALETLRAMALGGMRDHVGGGFHRYSVDAAWRVPHFEKMLYDQAQLVLAYLEAAQISGDSFFAAVAEDTLAYVRREMTDAAGGFYSAEDADSVPPEHADRPDAARTKSEGAFYLWSAEEVASLLGRDAPVWAARYGIEAGGNAPFDPQGEFTGRNLLYTARPVEQVAAATGRSVEDIEDTLARARLTLFRARTTRPRPHLDDKVLTAWNGLMIAAFARAARVLRSAALGGSPERAAVHLESAVRAASFVRQTMWNDSTRTLLRRYRDGDAAIDGYAEDYACLVWGLLELFQADGNPEWLEWALALQDRQDELFWDEGAGGWFSTTGEDPSVLMRLKEDYDGAEPAASSVSVANLLALGHLVGEDARLDRARRTFAAFAPRLSQFGHAAPFMLSALAAWHAGPSQIVLAEGEDDASPLLDVLATTYRPFAVVVRRRARFDSDSWRARLPFVGAMGPIDGRSAVYVCRDFACQRPVTAPDELRAML